MFDKRLSIVDLLFHEVAGSCAKTSWQRAVPDSPCPEHGD